MDRQTLLDALTRIGQHQPGGHDDASLFRDLPGLSTQVPDLFAEIQNLSLSHPQSALSAALGLEAALRSLQALPLLQGQSAWLAGWAANYYADTLTAQAALDRAEAVFHRLDSVEGWLAAVAWQRNALPWTRPDFNQAASELQAALAGLERTGMAQFILPCRLALIDALLRIKALVPAQEQLETARREAQDPLEKSRLRLLTASLHRRQMKPDLALASLDGLAEDLRQRSAPVEAAQVEYQSGMTWFLMGSDYATATRCFELALESFVQHRIELWEAACCSMLGQIELILGNPGLSEEWFARARPIYGRYGVLGMQADTYNDSGQLAIRTGDPHRAIELFTAANNLYRQLGLHLSMVTAETNLADALARLGRFQEALQILEKAAEVLKSYDSPFRLATVEYYQGLIWLSLHQPETALDHFKTAEALHFEVEQPEWAAWLRVKQAEVLIATGELDEASQLLDQAAEVFSDKPRRGLVHRLHAVTALKQGNPVAAARSNHLAADLFSAAGLEFELAASKLVGGQIHLQAGETYQARICYQQALEINHELIPEISWQARTGLGECAQADGDPATAFVHYRTACQTLYQTRQSLYQPALSASLVSASLALVDRAVRLSLHHGTPADSLALIDGIKATALNRQLANPLRPTKAGSERLDEMRQEINYLQAELRSAISGAVWEMGQAETLALRHRLLSAAESYAWESDRAARQIQPGAESAAAFNLETFRRHAGQACPQGWAALAYYLSDDDLILLVISPDRFEVRQVLLSPVERLALDACVRRTAQDSDFAILGRTLLPEDLLAGLSPENTLLISPHGSLHHLPWAALQAGRANKPLVARCIPLIVPSLHTFLLLSDRQLEPECRTGLAAGISQHRRYPALPQVQAELNHLKARLPAGSVVLLEEKADWPAIQAAVGSRQFGLLHLATHILHDSRSGRLSRIALLENDIWLDELAGLSPLPGVVVLSACSGMHSLVLDGDEQVGFPATCLASGARTVIGSQRPILDQHAGEIMIAFYDHYLSGSPPGRALALALRTAIRSGIPPLVFGAVQCWGTG
jgi:tetratricopeptide (TPR) repeat protein